MSELREKIIAEMRSHAEKARLSQYFCERDLRYPTWWFKQINVSATNARKELKRMEKEGLVIAFRKQPNNHRWVLVESLSGSSK